MLPSSKEIIVTTRILLQRFVVLEQAMAKHTEHSILGVIENSYFESKETGNKEYVFVKAEDVN